jgi:chromosome segregation ATPase
MSPSKHPQLQDLFDALREQKADLERIVNPLRERHDELQRQMHPLIEEQRVLAEEIKRHMPQMVELDNQIGALARAMGARTIGHK